MWTGTPDGSDTGTMIWANPEYPAYKISHRPGESFYRVVSALGPTGQYPTFAKAVGHVKTYSFRPQSAPRIKD